MPIPRSLIRKMAINNDVYTQGLSLANRTVSATVSPTHFAKYFYVSALFGKGHGVQAEFNIDNEHEMIENVRCTCQDFSEGKGACKHLIALLLKIENNFFSTDFARTGAAIHKDYETDDALKTLMSHRAAVMKSRAIHRAGGEKSALVPQLFSDHSDLRLGFKAGSDRLYVIRDLSELHQRLVREETAPCGKIEGFLYTPENFFNPKIVRFFMEYYPLCADDNDSKTIKLSPAALDRLFELIQDEKLNFNGQSLTFLAQNPDFALFIKRSEKFYRLSLSRRDFTVYTGQRRIYVKTDDTFYLCDTEFSDTCGELLTLFEGTDTDPIITDKEMPTFYSLVLKPASRFMPLHANANDFLPAALKTKLYLDYDGKKVITAKTEFCYEDQVYDAFDSNRDLKTVWDIEAETKMEELVRTYFPNRGTTPGTATLAADEEALFTLVHEGIPALSKLATLYISEQLKAVKLRPFPESKVGVRLESGLLKLEFSAGNLSIKELTAALVAYRQKKKYIRLHDGSFLQLDTETVSRLNHVTEGVGLSGSDLRNNAFQVPLYRALYLDAVDDVYMEKDKNFKRLAAAFSTFAERDSQVPDFLKSVLRDYQKTGFHWLKAISDCGFGGILADDMGLGKTLQVLALLTAVKAQRQRVRALVVCPASLVLNWEHEIRHFTPGLSALCVIGNTPERLNFLQKGGDYDVLITSYDMLKRDLAYYDGLSFDYEIIDEAQYIKNHMTQNAKAVKMIRATTRFALTGTPIENSMAEIWSIFDYLMPGYLYRYSYFRRRFEVPVVKENDEAALRELKKMTMPFILRRLKRDVLQELPEKTETVLYTNLAEEQEKLYHANLLSMRKDLEEHLMASSEENSSNNRMMVLAMLTRLRQICCDPGLIYENYKEESAKFEMCMNLVETSIDSGHKLLLFSQFTSMLALIEKRLKEKKIPYYLIQGSTKKEDRIAQVNDFNRDATPVFLISLKAGGTGLNLTGADVVIHYDPWWNLSAQNQATDRSHRIGQKNSVQVYKLIAKGTIEEKILALAEKKQSLADTILPDENNFLKGMTKAQILDLFKP